MGQPGRGAGRLQSIGPYTLLGRIGAGGMGVVYRALDRRSGTVVAFKLLHEHVALDPASVERFRREAHVASLLRSSYVVRTHEFGAEDGRYYLVSDFVDGRSLAEILHDGRVEPLAAVSIVTQAALALDEADSKGITHRDVKPDNILISEDGTVRLGDFGIASVPYLSGLTSAGTYVGTVAYSAAEQHRGAADIRSDIYSLGVVLYELLAGARPFDAPTAPELMRKHAEEPLDAGVLGRMPGALSEVVRRCLEKDPAARYQHPSELIAALGRAQTALGAAADGWMEASVRDIAATGVHAAAVVAPAEESDGAEALAATNVGEASNEPVRPAPAVVADPFPAVTRIDAPAYPSEGRAGGIPRRTLIIAGSAVLAVLGVAGAFAAFAGGDDDKPPPSDGETSPTAPSTATGLPSPTTTEAATPSASPGKLATAAPSGVATFGASPPATQGGGFGVGPTATAPAATNTPIPPTASPTTPAASFSAPIFAATLTQSGLPPAGGAPSGGTISGCPIRNLYAYVTHTNVPVGTQLTGSWSYQGQFQANNPTFATTETNGATNYNFGNPNGLPAGTYGFVLRSGITQVSAGSVSIQC